MVTKDVFDNVAAFDATNDIFDRNPKRSNYRVEEAVCGCQLTPTGFLFGLIGDDACGFVALKTGIFGKFRPVRKRISFIIANSFIVLFARVSPAEKTDFATLRMGDDIIFQGVGFFFPL